MITYLLSLALIPAWCACASGWLALVAAWGVAAAAAWLRGAR